MYLTQGLQRSLQQTPDRVATIFVERRHTFRQLGDRVARLAGALHSLGLAPGDRISMLALNSDRYLEYMMATWWAGGILNPINTRWAVPEIVYSLDDCNTSILFVDDQFQALVPGIRASAKRTPIFIYTGEGETPEGMLGYEQLIAQSMPVADAGRGGDDLACIMYTGGTTGFPKGVMQTHLNLWSGCTQRQAEFPLSPDTLEMYILPLFHIAGLARAVNVFIIGASHLVLSSFEPATVLAMIERHRATNTILVPTMIQALLAHPDCATRDLSSLKSLTYGASPTAGEVVEQLLARLPEIALFHSYGMTEASPIISTNPPANHTPQARQGGLSGSCGRGGFGVLVKVVNAQGIEVPRGVVGEIIVRGPNIMKGYWNKPEETAKALRDGWLFTSDGGYMDEQGYLFIVDRLKDMIVSGGENVYSAEVENVLARHPAVAMCAVIGVPHALWGEAVHAVVVRKPGAAVDEAQLRDHCRESIAGYKCPKTIEFRDQLPLSPAGKILKRDLREAFWADKGRAVN